VSDKYCPAGKMLCENHFINAHDMNQCIELQQIISQHEVCAIPSKQKPTKNWQQRAWNILEKKLLELQHLPSHHTGGTISSTARTGAFGFLDRDEMEICFLESLREARKEAGLSE